MQSSTSNMKAILTRKCLVTGLKLEKKDLIRFVLDPEKILVVDINQNLPGRGYWVKAERRIILKAIEKNMLFKASKVKPYVSVDLLRIIEKQIKRKIIDQISLSRKAGKAIFGFDKIKSSLLSKSIGLLVQASDGSEREKRRLLNRSIPKIIDNCLTSSELGKVFKKEKVIHCAILRSSFVENIVFNANHLNNLKNPVPQCNNIELSIKT